MLSCSLEKDRIGIQPYGDIDQFVIDSVSQILEQNYGAQIIVLSSRNLPESAFVNIKSPRYRADSLLIDLKNSIPDSIDYIIGITNSDISTTKRDEKRNVKEPVSKYLDWGIFGLGYRPGKACIISTYRIKNSNRQLFISRLQKISVHEIGHNHDLKHCKTALCVMQDAAETIKTVDGVGFNLCESCQSDI